MESAFCQALPYRDDSAELMRQLALLDRPVFLDSSCSASQHGRFDVLSALPVAFLQLQKGVLSSSDTLPRPAGQNLFSALETLLDRYRPSHLPTLPPDIPFTGGALGAIAYPRLSQTGTGAVLDACIGIYQWAIIVDHHARRSCLFFLPECSQETRRKVHGVLSDEGIIPDQFVLLENFSNAVCKDEYQAGFDRIKSYILSGDCYQVNLAQRFSSRFNGDPFDAYLKLRAKSQNPFSAFLRWGDSALLCLSPERFLQVQESQVMAQPVKGTRPRGTSTEQDCVLAQELQDCDKDRAENLMIVDLLRNDIGKLCEYGSVTVERLFELQSFNNVHHLVSTVRGRLRAGVRSAQLLENCFPGGSITGAPKIRAMQIIAELENFDRDYYCGSVIRLGFDGAMDSNITIRSLYCKAEAIHCWAGGAIVADSDWAAEYQECFDKINLLIKTLQNSI
jgi:para-aminobenzoate synthetase component I